MSILRVEKLLAGYDKRIVFSELDYAVQEGKITTIIGPNGCGKSTLLKTMGRVIKHKQGTVYLREEEFSRMDTLQIARQLTLLPQNPVAPAELLAEELVAYGRFPHQRRMQYSRAEDQAVIHRAMAMTRTDAFCQREIGSLSGGERQKVWLAMALAQNTPILLLDEPTTYLDMVHQLEVLKIIRKINREQQCTIVMVLHDINQAARFSHEVVAMKEGRIIASGTPLEVITVDTLKEVFNIQARVMLDPLEGVPVCFSYDTISTVDKGGRE